MMKPFTIHYEHPNHPGKGHTLTVYAINHDEAHVMARNTLGYWPVFKNIQITG